ncbi:MAG: hypothetical protein ABMA64_42460, partial [Myxococcota bacterium]
MRSRSWGSVVGFAMVVSLSGCEMLDELLDEGASSSATDSASDTGAVEDPGNGGGNGNGGGGNGGGGEQDEVEPTPGWTVDTHPCIGNRTDTLWMDDADTFWVGCGTTTNGYGLYVTYDGGASWSAPDTDPGYFLSGMRVDSITRSADGLLYVAGIAGAYQVVSVDTSVEPHVVEEVFTSSGVVWDTWQVGDFARNSEGLSVAESLNGYGLAYRYDDAEPFSDGYTWNPGSYQILDLVLHDDEFYGVGSTISQPPMVFLPPEGGQDPANGFQLTAVQLVDGLGAFAGELYGIAVDPQGIAVVGVDQGADAGTIFVSGADPYDADDWRFVDVRTIDDSEPTWMRGVCRRGAT